MPTIRQLRESRNLSQEDVARQLDVSVTTVYRWERGANPPQRKHARRLAEMFDVPVSEIELITDQKVNDERS